MCDKEQTFRTEWRETKVENEEKREKGCILHLMCPLTFLGSDVEFQPRWDSLIQGRLCMNQNFWIVLSIFLSYLDLYCIGQLNFTEKEW